MNFRYFTMYITVLRFINLYHRFWLWRHISWQLLELMVFDMLLRNRTDSKTCKWRTTFKCHEGFWNVLVADNFLKRNLQLLNPNLTLYSIYSIFAKMKNEQLQIQWRSVHFCSFTNWILFISDVIHVFFLFL